MKEKESKICSLVGGVGPVYAIRKELYVPLDKEAMGDFLEPFKIYEKGFRSVYEKKAIAIEKAEDSLISNFYRRIRISNRGFSSIFKIKNLMNPFKYGFFSFQLISHRLFRWIMPLFLLGVLISNIFLGGIFYRIILCLQLVFYIGTLVNLLIYKKKLLAPFYFVFINFAIVVGFLKFIIGKREIIWETVR